MKINITFDIETTLDELHDLGFIGQDDVKEDNKDLNVDIETQEETAEPCEICGATSPEECERIPHLKDLQEKIREEWKKGKEQKIRQWQEDNPASSNGSINADRASLLLEENTSLNNSAYSEKGRILTQLSTEMYKQMVDEVSDLGPIPSQVRNEIKQLITRTIWKTFNYNVVI